MLAGEAFHGRHRHRQVQQLPSLAVGNLDHRNLAPLPGRIGIRAIQHHMDLEGAVTAGRQVQVQLRAVAFLGTDEGIHTLVPLLQAAETEVFEADDATVGNTGHIHVIAPDVVVVLHPVLVGQVAGIAGGIVGVRRQAENLETLARDLGAGIDRTVRSGSRPDLVLGIRIVPRDAELASVGHFLVVPFDLHGRHHRLAGIAETARRAVVEDIPLAVDFLQGTVRVVRGI